MTLDKKASYSTSREGNRLIVNVFSAKMKSSIKQIEVRDPVIKSITAKQVGNSVKSVVELVNQDMAYRPSTSTDPFQIFIDIWQISPKTALKQPSGGKDRAAVPAPVESIEVDSSEAQRTKEITLDVRKTPEEKMEKGPSLELAASTPPTQNVPAQLQWFSEKLSQVLQEREKLKQELLEVEKSFAVKDSMIQVLERKVKEANTRIVELEEELIKAKSITSLAEQNERAIQDALDQVLAQLSGEQIIPVSDIQEKPIQGNSDKILTKISALQRESMVLGETKTKIEELNTQLASLTKERDELQIQAETCSAEITVFKANAAKLVAIEQELRVKEGELTRLRQAIGAAAQLAMDEPGRTPIRSVQPEVQTVKPETMDESQITTQVAESVEQDDPQLVLADLIQQQQLLEANPEDYILGPEDVVQIVVLKEENLDKTVTVSSDGFITYPLLGDLRVDGLTTAQVDAQITSLLARDFLVDPEVVVEVVKQRDKKVYIMGLVKQPGYQEISKDQRLLNTLLNAGGPVSFNTEVRVLRLPKDVVGDGAVETLSPIVVDLHKLFVEGEQTQNIVLHDGDVLMVAEKTSFPSGTGGETSLGPHQFYVVGSVVNPGVYNYKQNDTILDAVLRAGGFTEFASRNSTKLVRESDGKTRTFRIKMKDVMEKGEMDKNMEIIPGDMIIVPESFF